MLEESNCLDANQTIRKMELIKESLHMLDQEEAYWHNRCHEQWLLQGDNNTSYFHKIANGRKRKNNVISLDNEGAQIEGDENLLKHATEYYTNLFGPEKEHNIHIDQSIWDEIEKLSDVENDGLCKPFSKDEIKTALFQMERNKAAGPDKISIEFYQTCWEMVKDDIVQLFSEFHEGKVNISRINYGIITLLPKVSDAKKIQQFRPICLLNCLYKLITKTLTLRIEKIADKLIHSNQSAFMKGRNIMHGIMVLHEILHETKRKKQVGIILKLDFEKAYDKVKWKFLFECLATRGFYTQWCQWIEQVVSGGTVSVKLNNPTGPYTKSFKGVRRGDPLSPILFNFVADGLSRMICRAQVNNLIYGLIDHIVDKGVVVLQYADDTILCLKHSLEGARNLKILLYIYELMAGLKINFNKSEVMTINDEEGWDIIYADIFNCQIGSFPTKYLGVQVSPSRLHIVDWLPLVEKSSKRLDVWKGGSMSIAGRSTLICSSLNNAPIYQMSIYLLPKTITTKLDKIRRTFFWQGGGTKRKYHLIKWSKICKSKKKGGLGIKDIRKMNISLLCKWWWKLESEDGLWQKIIKYKYMKRDSVCTVKHRQTDSPIWADLLKIRHIYLQGKRMCVNNGIKTLFWLDCWLYEKPLAQLYSDLFKLAVNQKITVYEVINDPKQVSFSRYLVDGWKSDWEKILYDIDKKQFLNKEDVVTWKYGE